MKNANKIPGIPFDSPAFLFTSCRKVRKITLVDVLSKSSFSGAYSGGSRSQPVGFSCLPCLLKSLWPVAL